MSCTTVNPTFAATLFLLTYNQQETVEAAALSCLNQTCEPIEIIFSDDCSSDGTLAKLHNIAAQYQGQHHLRVRQNFENLGIARHYNQAVCEASAELIVVAAGDDISAPHRVSRILEYWRASQGQLALIASYAMGIDNNGKTSKLIQTGHLEKWRNAQAWCKKRPYVIGATFAFHKKIFSVFGPLSEGVDYEDQVLSFRAASMGGGVTIQEPLVQYRQGGLSSSQSAGHEALLSQAQNKYRRQLAVYTQITEDLAAIDQLHLSHGKIASYIKKSKTALALIDQAKQRRSAADLMGFLIRNPDCPGMAWSMIKLLWVKYPRVAYALKQKI